ncbi:hypothetical protein V8F06_001327 [Rhypophila decipiens]
MGPYLHPSSTFRASNWEHGEPLPTVLSSLGCLPPRLRLDRGETVGLDTGLSFAVHRVCRHPLPCLDFIAFDWFIYLFILYCFYCFSPFSFRDPFPLRTKLPSHAPVLGIGPIALSSTRSSVAGDPGASRDGISWLLDVLESIGSPYHGDPMLILDSPHRIVLKRSRLRTDSGDAFLFPRAGFPCGVDKSLTLCHLFDADVIQDHR